MHKRWKFRIDGLYGIILGKFYYIEHRVELLHYQNRNSWGNDGYLETFISLYQTTSWYSKKEQRVLFSTSLILSVPPYYFEMIRTNCDWYHCLYKSDYCFCLAGLVIALIVSCMLSVFFTTEMYSFLPFRWLMFCAKGPIQATLKMLWFFWRNYEVVSNLKQSKL